MKDQLLEIEVRLLVLRYGRRRVINVLARLGEQTLEQLEQQLRAIEQEPKTGHANLPARSLIEVAESECRARPDILEPLRTLALNFENRVFLTNLRDVKRYLDQIGVPHKSLKSRKTAGPVLIRALSKMPRDELLKLLTTDESSRDSDFALLSRAIMGTTSTTPE